MSYICTLFRLGISNVFYIAWYRISLKTGLRRFCFPQQKQHQEVIFFKPLSQISTFPEVWTYPLIEDANRILEGYIRYYGRHWEKVADPPDWFSNPFNGRRYPGQTLHWTKLPDFSPEGGDIKNIWEPSRFEWIVTLARAYAVAKEKKYLERINSWLNSWTKENPINVGPNWKCGQEASIRIFNLINASLILDQWQKPTKPLTDLIYAHLIRINSNIRYAIAQDNNHGTSEAAGLFIGGNWLKRIDPQKYSQAGKIASRGRKVLENRIHKLVQENGSFSQHSVNYHRVLLDTLSFSEFWRQRLNLIPFSGHFYLKTKAVIHWLWMLTDPVSGRGPNLGSNDGAMLLNLHSCDYLNLQPSIQLAEVIFNHSTRYSNGCWNEPLNWFGLSDYLALADVPRQSKNSGSGYTVIIGSDSWALLRWPYFKYRPSHNDIFHFDLWYQGRNVICDAGTYSYYPEKEDDKIDLQSVHYHNTVSFDGLEQMPRISRFLLTDWTKPGQTSNIDQTEDGSQHWLGSYIDGRKNHHERQISVHEKIWTIIDTLSGSFNEALIGFSVEDLSSRLELNILLTGFGEVIFPKECEIVSSESLASYYYMEKHPVRRLSVKVTKPGSYVTRIKLR